MNRKIVLVISSLVLVCCNSRKAEITDDTAVTFAMEIESGVMTGNRKMLVNKFDVIGFEDKCLQEINSKEVKKPLGELKQKYLQESISSMEIFLDGLIQSVNDGGYFKFSKHYSEKGSHHLIFSCYSWMGVNFIDFEISNSGKPLIVDYYDFYIGDSFSNIFSNRVLNEISFGSLTGEYTQLMKKVNQVKHYDSNGDYQRAWELLDEVPPKFNTKSIQQLRLNLSKKISEDAYKSALTDFIQSDSSDVRFCSYQSMNYYFLVKDYDKALQEIKDLRSIIGDDLMFDLLEGDCFRGKGDYAKAIDKYDHVIASYPRLYHPYYFKMESFVLSGNREGAEGVIKSMKETFNLPEAEVDSLYGYIH